MLILFSGKNKKSINLFSADFAQRVVKVKLSTKTFSYNSQFYTYRTHRRRL